MARGMRQGMMLEGWKFAVYLAIPIGASVYYNDTQNQKKAADYWQYVKYPANPATGWKEHIEAAASQREQRKVYREQLQQLNNSGSSSSSSNNSAAGASIKQEKHVPDGARTGWLRWIGLGRISSSSKRDTVTASESTAPSSSASSK